MKLPRYTATTPPAREPIVKETGLVRATDISALTDTGEQLKYQGLGQIGKAIQGVASDMFAIDQHKRELDRDLKASQFEMALDDRDINQYDSLSASNIKYQDEAETALAEIKRNRIKWIQSQLKNEKDAETRNRMRLIANKTFARFAYNSKGITDAKWTANRVQGTKDVVKNHVRNGDIDLALAEIDKLSGEYKDDKGNVLPAVISPQQADKFKKEWIIEEGINLSITNAANTLLPEDIEATEDMINKANLLEEEKMVLRDRLRTRVSLAQKDEVNRKEEIENNAYIQMDKADEQEISYKERYALGVQLKAELSKQGVATREMRNYIDKWVKGDEARTDDEIYDGLDDRVSDWQTGETEETQESILKDIRKARFTDKTISEQDYRNLKTRLKEDPKITGLNAHYLKAARSLLRDAIVTNFGIYGEEAVEKVEFRNIYMGLEEDVRNEKYSGKEIWERAAELAQPYIDDPIGRKMEKIRQIKEKIKEAKTGLEEEGAPERDMPPAEKVKNFLRSKGWGG